MRMKYLLLPLLALLGVACTSEQEPAVTEGRSEADHASAAYMLTVDQARQYAAEVAQRVRGNKSRTNYSRAVV